MKDSFKILFAGIVAVLILSAIIFFYSINPVHIDNPSGNTDYIWPSNSIWINATEGLSFGRFDKNGYNNSSIIDNPDMIILGSSHMEATNVNQNENVAFLLNQMFDNINVYNLGISGHDFYKVCQYLEQNLKLYSPKYTIIETTDVDIDQKNVDDILNKSIPKTKSHSTGVIAFLQKIPFLRMISNQIKDGLLDKFTDNEQTTINAEAKETEIDLNSYERLFQYLNNLQTQYNTKIIIVYHPTEQLHEDGTISFINNAYLDAFEKYSITNDISFINLDSYFMDLYDNEHKLPHGFSNGKVGYGHLNKYGHKIMAQAIYERIGEITNYEHD